LQKTKTQIWQDWVESIRSHNLQTFVAVILEAGGPLNTLAAQLVYISQPVMNGFIKDSRISALADLLEEKEHTQDFIQALRGNSQ